MILVHDVLLPKYPITPQMIEQGWASDGPKRAYEQYLAEHSAEIASHEILPGQFGMGVMVRM
jgi:hypothetical protein